MPTPKRTGRNHVARTMKRRAAEEERQRQLGLTPVKPRRTHGLRETAGLDAHTKLLENTITAKGNMLTKTDAKRREIKEMGGVKGFWWTVTGKKSRALRTLAERDAAIARKAQGILENGIAPVAKGARERSGLLKPEIFSERVKKRINMHGTHTMFFIDLDNFGRINAELGHQNGTRVIEALAKAIKRVGDKHKGIGKQKPSAKRKKRSVTSSRYGGEEFSLHITGANISPSRITRELDKAFLEEINNDPQLSELVLTAQFKPPTFSVGASRIDFSMERKNEVARSHGYENWLVLPKPIRETELLEHYTHLMDVADHLMKQRAKKIEGKNTVVFDMRPGGKPQPDSAQIRK